MDEKIILYSTHCPKCHVLEMKLKSKGIEYIENDDIQVMIDKGMQSAPALEVNGVMMGYKEAVEWIKEQ